MSLHVEDTPLLSKLDRDWLRRTWLKVQDHRCAACRQPSSVKVTHGGRWVLDYDRKHGVPACVRGRECWDCVLGVVCRECMFHLVHLKKWRGYLPRNPVNDVDPLEWNRRALAHLDLGVSLARIDRFEGRYERQEG